jgi:hypothetical protein
MQMYQLRPISDRAFWGRAFETVAGKQLLASIRGSLPEVADRLPMPTAADFLAARRSNDRNRVDIHWQKHRMQFAELVANRLADGAATDDRLLNWIFDYAFEATWAVSAHLPERDLPVAARPTLDLAACELAADLAEAREVLAPWIAEQSASLVDSLIVELDRHALTPLAEHEMPHWASGKAGWVNNWSGVCGGAMLMACQSMEAQGFARPAARKRAIEALHVFWDRAFTASGECDEGPGYFNYGVEFGVMPLMRMTCQQIEAEFNVARIKQVAAYLERCHVYGNHFYAANDSGPFLRACSYYIPWLAEFADSNFLRWWHQEFPNSAPGRRLPMLLRQLAMAEELENAPKRPIAAPAPQPARLLPDQQIAIIQRPSQHGLFTFGISGGNNGESHNHNDLGSFQVLLNGVAWVPDMGMPQYTTDFFSSVRYTKYMVAASSGHCCPQINGHEQRAGHDACGTILAYEPEAGKIALDLSSAYPAEAGLQKWTRSAAVPTGEASARITDSYTLKTAGPVVHRIWLREKPTVNGQTLQIGPVRLTVTGQAERVEVKEFACDDPRLLLREHTPSGKVYRADFTYRCPAGQPLTVETLIHLV